MNDPHVNDVNQLPFFITHLKSIDWFLSDDRIGHEAIIIYSLSWVISMFWESGTVG